MPTIQRVPVILWALIENNSKFLRGKKRVGEDIQYLVDRQFSGQKLNDCEYRFVIQYKDDADLKEQIDELFAEINRMADWRNCFADDASIKHEITGAHWDVFRGCWQE